MFQWLPFLTYINITVASPGANCIMAMSVSASSGFKKAIPFIAGIWTGFSLVMLMCTALSSILYDILSVIRTPMLMIGAAYMLYLAWKIATRSSEIQQQSSKSGFLAGFLLQFANPKIYFYCFIAMEAYILPYFQTNPLALIGFAFLLSSTGVFYVVIWSAFASLCRVLFSKYARITNTAMALLLIYCAVSLFL